MKIAIICDVPLKENNGNRGAEFNSLFEKTGTFSHNRMSRIGYSQNGRRNTCSEN